MKKTFLYRHFDRNGDLLYVGISLNHMARLQQHKDASGWFDKIVHITVEQFETRQAAMDAETNAIQKEKPIHNVHKNNNLIPAPERVEDSKKQLTYKIVSLQPLYNAQETARLLGISGHAIRSLIEKGILGHVTIGPVTDRLSPKGTPFKPKTYITGWQILDCLEYLMEGGQ